MATIKDIAKLSNVSIATVSNVLNNTCKVKDSTKARVMNAAYELGYENRINELSIKPHSREGVIGIIVEDFNVFNVPKIIDGICSECERQNFQTLIINLNLLSSNNNSINFNPIKRYEKGQAAVNELITHKVCGIIYVGTQSMVIENISKGFSVPITYAYCYSKNNYAPSIVYDDINISQELISILIKNGHKKIGVIAGPEESVHVRDRMIGFQKVLFNAKILYNPENTHFVDWETTEFAYHAAEKLMQQNVTAIFCLNDVLAGGVMDYANRNNLKVPKDISLVGFDNLPSSSAFYPKLTTVELPLKSIGEVSASELIKLVHAGGLSTTPYKPTVLPCEIILRDSVLKIK